MSVPVPLDLTIAEPPVGWTSQAPDQFSDLVSLVAELLQGSIQATFITGQVGGSNPSAEGDIGPWNNGDEWWFWDYSVGGYAPSQQGCPVGTVAMWGGKSTIPARWLHCTGAAISTSYYSRLFNAIGYKWGAGAAGTFKLPPSGVFYLNGANYLPDPTVPITQGGDADNGNMLGGTQISGLIQPNNLPACMIRVPYLLPSIIDSGGNDVVDIQAPGGGSYAYSVTDLAGNVVGTNQQPISIMPPFASINFIIKYL